MNGFDNITAPVESIDTLVELVRRQATPLGHEYDFIVENATVRRTSAPLEGEYTVLSVCRDRAGNIYTGDRSRTMQGNKEYPGYPGDLKPL